MRLSGACNGCSMAGVTMRDGVEKALVEGVASVTAVEVLPDEPRPDVCPRSRTSSPADAAPMAETGGSRPSRWSGSRSGRSRRCRSRPTRARHVEVIVVNAAGQMAAYVNACAHQGMPLDKAIVDATEGTLTCPWHGFCFDTAHR